ncbi:MAG: hypothetical protein KF879_12540 [Saprospiraceae bacterium]|nr:hypothetical protein [Saprospiraceae bacterium]
MQNLHGGLNSTYYHTPDIKTRHSGYLSHRGKTARLERLHQQMNLPPPMPKVSISTALRVLMLTPMLTSRYMSGMQKR